MSQNNPKITVITPAYNADQYIEETIRSLQNQSLGDYEHIIIDDGSTERTAEIVHEYAKGDKRIRHIYQKIMLVFRRQETQAWRSLRECM